MLPEKTHLLIRNLSTTSLKLTQLERFTTANLLTSRAGNSLLSSLSSFTRSRQKGDEAQTPNLPHTTTALNVTIAPFHTLETDIPVDDLSAQNFLLLTLTCSDQGYKLELPFPSSSATTSLTPVHTNPRHAFSATFHPAHHHVAILSCSALDRWMGELPSAALLSTLSIPGTHNSPTYHRALPSVRCQSVGTPEQLRNGVRFFDVRVQVSSDDITGDDLTLVHGAFPIALTGPKYFRRLVDRTLEFLTQQPSEAVLMSVKREGVGSGTDMGLSRILARDYVADRTRWYAGARVPTLGEVRGKIVLIRRFWLDEGLAPEHGEGGFGIDASRWPDNALGELTPDGRLCVQDFYNVTETGMILKKASYCEAHLQRAHSGTLDAEAARANNESTRPLYLNFLSASNLWRTGCWPENIAAVLNPRIIQYLCCSHAVVRPMGMDDQGWEDLSKVGSTGVVVCDWVGHGGDWDLVQCIVAMNGRLKLAAT